MGTACICTGLFHRICARIWKHRQWSRDARRDVAGNAPAAQSKVFRTALQRPRLEPMPRKKLKSAPLWSGPVNRNQVPVLILGIAICSGLRHAPSPPGVSLRSSGRRWYAVLRPLARKRATGRGHVSACRCRLSQRVEWTGVVCLALVGLAAFALPRTRLQ